MQTLYNYITGCCNHLYNYITGCCRPEPEQYEQRYELSDHNEWKNNGEGNFEFTGINLDKVPDDIKGKMIHLHAPNLVGELQLVFCDALHTVNAPKADALHFWYLPSLKTVNAPNARSVHAGFCEKLQSIDIPRATKVAAGIKATKVTTGVNVLYTRHYPSAMTDALIKAVNPQKIEIFNLLYPSAVGAPDDIAPCIKSADRELNGSDDSIQKRAQIARFGIKDGKISDNPTKANEESIHNKTVKSWAVSSIGEFLEQKDIHKLQFLSSKGYKEINRQSNLSNYANLDKTNIAQKTHAHTDMKNAQTTGRVRSDVPVGFGY